MPYRWNASDTESRLTLWPHRSMPRGGFALVILFCCAMLSLPLIAVLGTFVVWGVLPFAGLAVGGLWAALRRNYRDAALTEELVLGREEICLTRSEPGKPDREWRANPHWVRVELHATGGPVEDYLTLAGGPREVELGAFLSAEERRSLRQELSEGLARLR